MNHTLTREQFLAMVDHTLLKPETTSEQCADFVSEASLLGVARVCISPQFVPLISRISALPVVSVVGFPSGAHATAVKAFETKLAIDAGASEIDVVADFSNARTGRFGEFERELAIVREAAGEHPLKVILETACLTDEQIYEASLAAARAGCDFVKTSTGFHPAGGASVQAVTIMREAVGDRLGIKASGGIRSAVMVRALSEAGATRFGLSATSQILEEWDSPTPSETAVSEAAVSTESDY